MTSTLAKWRLHAHRDQLLAEAHARPSIRRHILLDHEAPA